MGQQWFIWVSASILLIAIVVVIQFRHRRGTRLRSAEEELERIRDDISFIEIQLASQPEGDPEYWALQERLNQLKASEWMVLTEWTLINGKRVEAYECPKCLGKGRDERSVTCEFCGGAGIISAERLHT